MLRKKRFLVDVKTKYFLLETKMWGVKTEQWSLGDVATSKQQGPGGHSENLSMETCRSFLRGSWRICTPPSSCILLDCSQSKLRFKGHNPKVFKNVYVYYKNCLAKNTICVKILALCWDIIQYDMECSVCQSKPYNIIVTLFCMSNVHI